mmetsp:Transcript_80265/g.134186  ORF Transcript_80265/g.134186 Transcript_80265/m.134186 type:complete len:86 (+) Transcript_80265:640-897(+)
MPPSGLPSGEARGSNHPHNRHRCRLYNVVAPNVWERKQSTGCGQEEHQLFRVFTTAHPHCRSSKPRETVSAETAGPGLSALEAGI